MVIGEGAPQDSRQDPAMAGYGMAEDPSPPSVSNHIHMCIVGLIIRTHQYATGLHTYLRRADLKFVPGIPEEQQYIFPVGVNTSSSHIFSTKAPRRR